MRTPTDNRRRHTLIGLTEFNTDKPKRDGVIEKGRQAADKFLASWNWNAYKAECRGVDDAQ